MQLTDFMDCIQNNSITNNTLYSEFVKQKNKGFSEEETYIMLLHFYLKNSVQKSESIIIQDTMKFDDVAIEDGSKVRVALFGDINSRNEMCKLVKKIMAYQIRDSEILFYSYSYLGGFFEDWDINYNKASIGKRIIYSFKLKDITRKLGVL